MTVSCCCQQTNDTECGVLNVECRMLCDVSNVLYVEPYSKLRLAEQLKRRFFTHTQIKSLDGFLLHDFQTLTHASLMARSREHAVEDLSMAAKFTFVVTKTYFCDWVPDFSLIDHHMLPGTKGHNGQRNGGQQDQEDKRGVHYGQRTSEPCRYWTILVETSDRHVRTKPYNPR